MTNFVLLATITYYCACAKCTPRPVQPTAIGTKPIVGKTIAAPRWVPLGTKVFISGIGWRVVHDRTALRFNGRWDVYVGADRAAHRKALKLGKQKTYVRFER